LKNIQKICGPITTFTIPEITLLELLSYAITDVARRATFPVKDILAEKMSPEIPREKQFYTAAEILTSTPVTITDFRKVMIDHPGIKNAWIKTIEQEEPAVYINQKKERLQFDEEEDLERLLIRGLYDITLELDEDPAAGDLNHFTEVIPVDSSDETRGNLIIRMPHWDEWRDNLYPDHEIKSVTIKKVESTGRFLLEGEIEIRTAGHKIKKEFTIRTTIGSIDVNVVKTRLEESAVELYRRKLQKALGIVNQLMDALHRNRNLSEDFTDRKG
jgi:hypothetical protein